MDVPDVGHRHGHGHGTGVPWLDIIIGVSAMFVSVVSLVVSIGHGRTMEKMVDQNERIVAADTMPFLTIVGSNADPVSLKRSERLALKNGGVGPAIIDWVQLKYKDVAYGGYNGLLQACCSEALAANGGTRGVIYSNVSGSIMPAREGVDIMLLTPGVDSNLQEAFDRARSEIHFSGCYCSVLNDCWETNFDASRPKPVAACVKPSNGVIW